MDRIDIKRKFPDWRIVRCIGTGACGSVYEIERERMGKREKAALKVIRIPSEPQAIDELRMEGYDENSIKNRIKAEFNLFASEYDRMRMLTHTNIVSCDDLEYEKDEDGVSYLIYLKMELLTPLTDSLARQSDPEQVAVWLGYDICQALRLCEAGNIVHRDIKPQNLFVNRFGAYKLGDFGIAKQMELSADAAKSGAYQYMAPEVYKGEAYHHWVDIYSLGLVMYWLLNEKRLPFLPLPPAVCTSTDEFSAAATRFRGEKLPPPKHGSEELKQIVLKACAYDPADRFGSADEMAAALQALTAESAAGSPLRHTGTAQPENRADRTVKMTVDRTRGNSWVNYGQTEEAIEKNSGTFAENDKTVALGTDNTVGVYTGAAQSGGYSQPPRNNTFRQQPAGAVPSAPEGAYAQQAAVRTDNSRRADNGKGRKSPKKRTVTSFVLFFVLSAACTNISFFFLFWVMKDRKPAFSGFVVIFFIAGLVLMVIGIINLVKFVIEKNRNRRNQTLQRGT